MLTGDDSLGPRRTFPRPSTISHSNSTCILMLSNQTSNLHPRQHRRQNSTPTTFDAQKVPLLPATLQQQQSHGSHRRGLSLDQHTHTRHQRHLSPQDDRIRSTNPGLPLTQQHILREAQPQLLARPGQPLQQPLQQPVQQPTQQPVQQPPKIYIENEIFEPPRGLGQNDNQTFSSGPVRNQRYIKQDIDFENVDLSEIFAHAESQDLSSLSSFNTVPSAGYLDGFGLELNDLTGETQYDEGRKAENMPSYDGNTQQQQVQHDSSETPQRPYTPTNQSNHGKSKPQALSRYSVLRPAKAISQ